MNTSQVFAESFEAVMAENERLRAKLETAGACRRNRPSLSSRWYKGGIDKMPKLTRTTSREVIDFDAAQRLAEKWSGDRGLIEPNLARAYLALRAELAQAREEIANLRADLYAEKAAREKKAT